MTLKELRTKINRFENKEYLLNELTVEINLPQVNLKKELVGYIDIYRFVKKQLNSWKKQKKLQPYLEHSKKYFEIIVNDLEKYIEEYSHRRFYNNSEDYLNEAKILLAKNFHQGFIFTYDAPETNFLMNLYLAYPNSVKAAARFFANGTYINQELDSYTFIGMQQAYEFRLQDNERVRRSELEKKSLEELRDEFNKYIVEAQDTLDKHVQENTKMLQEKTEHIESLISEKGKLYTDWFSKNDSDYTDWLTQTKENFNNFDTQTKQTIKDNELLYGEKLKLEKPADYWQKRATKLEKEGKKWLTWLIITSSVAVALLLVVLLCISTDTFIELFKDAGTAIRWSIGFVAFISFLAFGIRTFAKLMFSAYHLARDAEEREQLAYVYLALVNDKNIEEKERHLVLQSLFSRADSGLLKADAAPTMPGFLDKFIKQ